MDKKLFLSECEKIALSIGINTPNVPTLNLYYEHLKNIDDEKFSKMCKKLIPEIKPSFSGYRSFPLIGDFIKIKIEMAQHYPIYKPDPHRRDPNYGAGMQRVLWGFKQMDKIRHIEIPGCDDMSQSKVSDIIQEFWRKVRKNGKIFSLSTEKWIDRKNAINSTEYFDPAEFGLGIY